jgi:hypothetical protein
MKTPALELISIYPGDSGLPMTVWAGRGTASRTPARYARIRVSVAHGAPASISNTAVVAVRPSPRLVAGDLSAADLRAVTEWVRLNEAALVAHWDGQISGVELGRRLQRLP